MADIVTFIVSICLCGVMRGIGFGDRIYWLRDPIIRPSSSVFYFLTLKNNSKIQLEYVCTKESYGSDDGHDAYKLSKINWIREVQTCKNIVICFQRCNEELPHTKWRGLVCLLWHFSTWARAACPSQHTHKKATVFVSSKNISSLFLYSALISVFTKAVVENKTWVGPLKLLDSIGPLLNMDC